MILRLPAQWAFFFHWSRVALAIFQDHCRIIETFPTQDTRSMQGHVFANRFSGDRSFVKKEDSQRSDGQVKIVFIPFLVSAATRDDAVRGGPLWPQAPV